MKIGSTFNHEIYGPLTITGKRYSRMGNKSLWIGTDEQGETHELDGSEKPAKAEKTSPKFLKEAAEMFGMTQGPQGEKGIDADEEAIIQAVFEKVLPLIPTPENGKDGADADTELIVRELLPLVMEKMPRPKELNEALIIQKVVSRIRIPQDGKPGEKGKDGSPDTPSQVKEKLETLKGDERLDASAIKNLPKPTMQFGGDSYTGLAKIDSAGTPGTLEDKIVAGTNVTITKVNDTLRIAASGGGGSGTVETIVAGNNIDVDATDPANPIVSVETLTLADISDVTASATELNYVDGVTSAIQTQLDGKVSDTGDTMTGALTIGVAGNALSLKNSSDSASVQVAIFEGDRATMADNDEAYITLRLSDDAGTQTEFARMAWRAVYVNAGTSLDGILEFYTNVAGTVTKQLKVGNGSLSTNSNDQLSLGVSGTAFSDLFLASGGVINWNAGNYTITHSAGLLTMNGGLATTIANTANTAGLEITQNDTTNNPKALSVTNAGTGNAIYIDANGNTGTTASSSGALFLDNTGNTGTGANFYTNGATVGTTGVLFAKVDNASATGPVVRLDNDGTGNTLQINANGNVGTTNSTSGALRITNTANTGWGLNVYSDAGAAAGALVRIMADNALFDQPALHIVNDGTAGGAASIRCDGVSPQIEFVETDQTTPAGKFEIQVQGDIFYFNGRNAGDSSFENVLSYERLADGGGLYFHGTTSGTTKIVPAAAASGVLTLPAATDTLVGKATTDTLTNKRVTPRTGTTTSSATPTINTDNVDIYEITAQTVDITSFTTNLSGTPTLGQLLRIYITGTAARAITWGSSFEASTVALPTTTVSTNTLDVGFRWNATTSKWRCIASA